MEEELIDVCKKYVKELLKQKTQQHNYSYHNWKHSENVMKEAIRIARNCELSDESVGNLAISALFHDVGYEIDSEEHEKRSAEIAEKFLRSKNVEQKRIGKIKRLIMATRLFTVPNSIEEMVIKDADLSHLGKPYFFRNYYSLQEELNTVFQLNINDEDWCSSTIEFLNKQEYYTNFAKENYRPLKMQNLKQLIKMKEEGISR